METIGASAMAITDPCRVLVTNNVHDAWLFVSDYGKAAIVALLTIKAAFHYLLRSPIPEARELGCALAVACLFGLYVVLSETYPPEWITRLATVCVQDNPSIATSNRAPNSSQNDTHVALGAANMSASRQARELATNKRENAKKSVGSNIDSALAVRILVPLFRMLYRQGVFSVEP